MIKDDEILAIITSELSDVDYEQSDNDLETSLEAYLGRRDGREVQGRSQVTSTDVADTIEWIMPQIMKSFTQNNEVVIFDPVASGDEDQAEMESEFVYDLLMKENDGFIVLHQFVKDALMQRNGIIKVYYDESTEEIQKEFTGITEEQFNMLVAPEDTELVEVTQKIDEMASMQTGQEVRVYDVKVLITKVTKKIQVDSVPPEEFRVNSFHNSINLDTARFTAHIMLKTVSDLLEMGVPRDQIDEMNEGFQYDERVYRFTEQDEDNTLTYESVDDSQRLVEVTECYMMIDLEGDGIATLNKITVAGSESPTAVISVEQIDKMPWVATTPFLMSHKFIGLSIYDRIIEIQNQKTTLWRNMFDNMYLQNNQRNVVLEGQVNMDDLLVSRPGGIIRVKSMNAVTPLVTPQIGQDAYQMMDYLDRVRAGRSGVDPDGNATPMNIGDRVGSEGVERIMNAKEELVGLIIRVIAETGIKPLMYKIRDEAVKHIDAIKDYRFRGQWQQVAPMMWRDRTLSTVRVGTGTGNHTQQVAAIREILTLQEKIMADPRQNITNQKKIFDTIDDYCKFSGLNGAVRYFVDPASEEGQQMQKQADEQAKAESEKTTQMEQAMAQSQIKLAEAEMGKAEAQQQGVQFKAQADIAKNQLAVQEQSSDTQIDLLKQQLNEAEVLLKANGQSAELEFRYEELDSRTAVELTRIKSQSVKDTDFEGTKKEVEASG